MEGRHQAPMGAGMRTENVEIYTDQSNAVVLRHPGRKFPGVLVQGDTLYALWQQADEACAEVHGELPEGLDELRSKLRELVDHYKVVLETHGVPLPFYERPSGSGTE